ncbi:MAG: hypothetical protein ACK5XQ_03675, partial [Flavobacteriales bacterium]
LIFRRKELFPGNLQKKKLLPSDSKKCVEGKIALQCVFWFGGQFCPAILKAVRRAIVGDSFLPFRLKNNLFL